MLRIKKAPVLVLEDHPMHIAWFYQKMPWADVFRNARQAIQALAYSTTKYEVVFLSGGDTRTVHRYMDGVGYPAAIIESRFGSYDIEVAA